MKPRHIRNAPHAEAAAVARYADGGISEAAQFSMTDDVHYKVMRLLESNPGISQRDIARSLGISLGKANYCLRALIEKGWVKATNFTNSHNKAAYMYLLTPRGIEQKAALTIKFLKIKIREYEILKAEIRQIRKEAVAAQARRVQNKL